MHIFIKKMLLFLCLTLAISTFGTEIRVIKGEVRNSLTKEPIAGVQVYTKSKYGTLTNASGKFILKLPENVVTDSIYFSFIGYHLKKIALSDSFPKKPITLFLNPATNLLSEVVVKPKKALTLLEKAIENIPKNYSTHPLVFTGFYRQSMNPIKGNNHLIIFEEESLTEAVCKVKYSAYPSKVGKKPENNLLQLLAWRKVKTAKDSIFNTLAGASPHNTLELDLIKNFKSSLLEKKERKKYHFTYEGIQIAGGQIVYKLAFDQKEDIKENLYKGTILIDTGSLAFVQFDYQYSPRGLSYITEKKALFMGFLHLNQHFKISYHKDNEKKWRLHHARVDQQMKFNIHKGLITQFYFEELDENIEKISQVFKIQRQFVVHHVDYSGNWDIEKNELFTKKSEISKELNPDNDEIWGKYNYVLPD